MAIYAPKTWAKPWPGPNDDLGNVLRTRMLILIVVSKHCQPVAFLPMG
jgi:hypothetical protein